MNPLRDFELFLLVADYGSLSAAARHLDITPAAASAALKRLEAELDVQLFLRTTRSLRLTNEGRIFHDHCRQAMQLLADGKAAAQSGTSNERRVLQLSLPSDLGRNVLLPWLDEFQSVHPELHLRLLLTDRPADIYRQPVDLAFRYGNLRDSALVALPVAPDNRRILCAAPAYLERHGTPTSPQELTRHNCLCFLVGDTVHDRWHFSRGEREYPVRVRGDRISDDGDVARRWALSGQGIAYKSALDAAADLAAGRLIHLCPDFLGEAAPLHLICADRRQIHPLVKALQAFVATRCAALLSSTMTRQAPAGA